jgi:hypothetical protein
VQNIEAGTTVINVLPAGLDVASWSPAQIEAAARGGLLV